MSASARGKAAAAAGKRFERKIANDLREWLPDFTVTRNRADVQMGQDGVSAGEFSFDGPHEVALAFELKRRQEWNEAMLFKMPLPKVIEGYWAEAVDAANCCVPRIWRHPVLVMQTTTRGAPILAIMRPTASAHLVWCGRKPIMRLEVFSDSLEGEELSVWNWRTLTSIPSIRLAEIGR